MPFYPVRHYYFTCDDCGQEAEFYSTQFARKKKWAISKDYKKCYCAKCAPKHRNVGRNGVIRITPNNKEITK